MSKKNGFFSFVAGIGITQVLLWGCSTVKTTEDRASSVASYQRYSWLNQDDANQLNLKNPDIQYMAGEVHITQNPDIDNKIRPLIEKELNKQGWIKTEQEVPDVYVTYYGKTKDGQWVSTWSGSTPAVNQVPVVIFPNFRQDRAHQFREGQVFITLYDTKTKKAAWTTSVLSQKYGLQLDEKDVATAINDMLKDLPRSS
jgi:hypothetical protein